MKKIILIFLIIYANSTNLHKFNEINILSLVMQLNLNNNQKKKIKSIIQNCRKTPIQRPNFLKLSFKHGQFNKEKYIDIKTSFAQKRIQKQAQIIDKIIKILDKKQKQKLGDILDRNFND